MENEEKIIFNEYESFVNKRFTEDPELGLELIISCIKDYEESGNEKDIEFIILNISRIVKIKGYKFFEVFGLSENQIKCVIDNNENYNKNIINKILEALGIKERI